MVNALLLRPLPVSHPENLVRLVEVHPNDFVTWDLPYNFFDRAAAGDADFSEGGHSRRASSAYFRVRRCC
jgi:hypothetical protein